jgi:hypothetical protein
LILVGTLTSSAFANSFVNGSFESGNLSGWTQSAGYLTYGQTTNNLNPASFMSGGSQYNISANASGTVTAGLDANTDNHLQKVYGGTYSARVNDGNRDYSVSVLSQTVNNYTDSNIYFAWAAVLESSHGTTDSDVFQLYLTDNTTGSTLYNVTYNSANAASASLFTESSTGWYYTDWQVANLDVSKFAGDSFTLTLLASDCPYGGHAGYVYLDGFGAVVPPVSNTPEPATLALTGLGVIGVGIALRKQRKA